MAGVSREIVTGGACQTWRTGGHTGRRLAPYVIYI